MPYPLASRVGDLVAVRQVAVGSIQSGALICGAPRVMRISQPEVSIVL